MSLLATPSPEKLLGLSFAVERDLFMSYLAVKFLTKNESIRRLIIPFPDELAE